MSGTTMPRLQVRPRASELAAAWGAYRSSSAAVMTRRLVSSATARGWVKTRDTVAVDTPARAATSRMDMVSPLARVTSVQALTVTVKGHRGRARVAARGPGPFRGPWATRALDVVCDRLVERGTTVAATESTPTYRAPVCYSSAEVVEG